MHLFKVSYKLLSIQIINYIYFCFLLIIFNACVQIQNPNEFVCSQIKSALKFSAHFINSHLKIIN